jgi:beta-lactamase regulating signal transducer with metallopeptidase domain
MDHLLQTSVRSVLLAALAGLGLCRVKSASMRHAVWTLLTASMLVQIALSPLLPEIPLRVLRAAEAIAIPAVNQVSPAAGPTSALQVHAVMSWEQVVAIIYFCGLLFFVARLVLALLFAGRLVRESEPAGQGTYQSSRISAPVTIGKRILLPLSWCDWDAGKLRAVLAHEESHVRRHDWAIAVMARVNQCVFWFHPLAWWLERELARLAEQACDDAALGVIEDREQYARTLLDIARAIQVSKGRLLAVSNVSAPMAKEANVETRLNRILDETRLIPKALGGRGWTALATLAVPVLYMTATIQLAPAQTVVALPRPAPPPLPQVTVAQAQAPQAPTRQAAPAPPQSPAADAPPSPPLAQTQGLGGPIVIPKIYNGHNKTFFFFRFEDYLKQQSQNDSDSKFSVDISPERTVRLGIPVGATTQGEVIVMMSGRDGSTFNMGVRQPISGPKLELPVSLTLGAYHVTATILNSADGTRTAREFDFEVK